MKAGLRLLGSAAALMVISALLTAGKMEVKAKPASLESMSAVIYEQTSEESTPIGNLVQGSTFDLQGTVTAEDGSVWYIAATSNGVQGYIRGDAGIRTDTEEADSQASESGQTDNPPSEETAAAAENDGEAEDQQQAEGQEADENVQAQAGAQEASGNGQTQGEGQETVGNGQPQAGTVEDAGNAGETEDDPGNGNPPAAAGIIETGQIGSGRENTYALSSDKIKTNIMEETDDGSSKTDAEEAKSFSVSISFLAFLIVIVFSLIIGRCSYRRLKRDLNKKENANTRQSDGRKKNKAAVRGKKNHKKKKGR